MCSVRSLNFNCVCFEYYYYQILVDFEILKYHSTFEIRGASIKLFNRPMPSPKMKGHFPIDILGLSGLASSGTHGIQQQSFGVSNQ